MNYKKINKALLLINCIQFIAALAIWAAAGFRILGGVNHFIYFSIGVMLAGSILTIGGLYASAGNYHSSLQETNRNLEDFNTRLREERHDYLNHMQVVYGLMELEEYQEARNYLQPVFKDIMKLSKALKTSQPAVNALLQAKIEAAEKEGIDFFPEVHSNLNQLGIEPWELCKILANLIDNAITALHEKEGDKELRVIIREGKDHYEFCVENNGPKIPEERREAIFRQGFSTKKEEGHGMGLFIVSSILKENRGSIKVESDEMHTSFTAALPKKSVSLNRGNRHLEGKNV